MLSTRRRRMVVASVIVAVGVSSASAVSFFRRDLTGSYVGEASQGTSFDSGESARGHARITMRETVTVIRASDGSLHLRYATCDLRATESRDGLVATLTDASCAVEERAPIALSGTFRTGWERRSLDVAVIGGRDGSGDVAAYSYFFRGERVAP